MGEANQSNQPQLSEKEINEYTEHLERLRSNSSNMVIKNTTFDHAKILVSSLLSHAKKEVLIYSSSFCKQFYLDPKVFDAIVDLKKRKILPRFLIQHNFSSINNEHYKDVGQIEVIEKIESVFKELIEKEKKNNKNFSIFSYLDNGKKGLYYSDNLINNFTVVDQQAFRYERHKTAEDACINQNEYFTNAVGCMNDPDTAALLKTAFLTNFK